MKRLNRLLWVVVLLELGVAGWLCYPRERPRPPLPPLSVSSSLRDDFDELIAECKSGEDWHQLAEVYTAYGFYREAEACYGYLLSRSPNDPRLLFEAGFLLSRMARLEDANERFQAAIDAGYPTRTDCWFFIGRNLLRAELPGEAARAFARAGDMAGVQLQLARLRYRAGDYDSAMTLLEPVLASESDTIEPNTLAYLCALESGNLQAATKYAERAADTTHRITNPFYTQWQRLDNAMLRVGYRRRLAAAQDQLKKNHLDVAENLLLEARDVEWNEFTVGSLAELVSSQGDHHRAIALLQEIIDRRGPASVPLGMQANNLAQTNDLARAVVKMRQAIEAASEEDLASSFGKLASWSTMLQRADDAQHYRDLQQLWAGKSAFWRADWETAASQLRSASVRLDQSDETWFYLGETQRRLGERDKARVAYQRCLSLNPQHGGAHRGMAILQQE